MFLLGQHKRTTDNSLCKVIASNVHVERARKEGGGGLADLQ
jgi:hypothetical protein